MITRTRTDLRPAVVPVARSAIAASIVGFATLVPVKAAETPALQLQPIFTRFAQTAPRPYISGTIAYFEGVELQEAEDFDGWSVGADITVPFRQNMQFRVVLPLYTRGEATRTVPPRQGEPIDLEGSDGVFDFFSLIFEQQLKSKSVAKFAYFAGAGAVLEGLDTSTGDVFNHDGYVVLGGIKYDRHYPKKGVQFLGNFGGRYYFSSDDLNPTGGSDNFFMVDVSAAAIFRPWGSVYPVAELAYQGVDFDYNSLRLVPELIVPFNHKIQFKVGLPLGLTGDGEQLGLRLQFTGQF